MIACNTSKSEQSRLHICPPGRGVLPYVTLMGTCDRVCFSGCFVLNGVSISSPSVLNRVSLHDLIKQDKLRCPFIGLLNFNDFK